ncbi:response regulator transcription factor [Novosphingobium sp. 1949]|uniref:Response regulator transcription factor n=1 Tax=Novosphingobium organovorum TaxID=2930092 RepID=A0ABT0B9N0_9SPHN|nr:response regulator transcription factor [Novosphingobium organovorum]MCJ2181762.1 response regulator transcription factor [Novosphingobium organovorum]
MTTPPSEDTPSPHLLIVEDDPAFSRTLARSFERRGYRVSTALSAHEADDLSQANTFDYAVVDLKLGTDSGLTVVQILHARSPETHIVVLTGFASIATAVEAIKLGASHYLAKPSNSDDIEAAFESRQGDPSIPVEGRKTSIKTLEWEYIHQTLVECDFNISEAARRLGLHRRTLARKLEKRRV